MPPDQQIQIQMAMQSEKIKATQTPDYFVELLVLVREIHAMLKAQEPPQP